ncbi:MAG: SH3 domain-containing protein [Firmicutes bacterium]|nr:SH3 domain-containing protein [Bacillota bacterium]
MSPQTFGELAETLFNEEKKLLSLYEEMLQVAANDTEKTAARKLLELEQAQLKILGQLVGQVPPGVPPYICLARVIASRLNVRSGPGTEYNIITTLDYGTRVTILSYTDAWAKIKLADGTEGYVARRYVECEKPLG